DGMWGAEQVAIFRAEGVALHRVIIGHSCGSADLRYHAAMLEQGAWLGFDRIGLRHVFSDDLRFATLLALLRAGWAPRLVLSQDHVVCMLGRGVEFPNPTQGWRE